MVTGRCGNAPSGPYRGGWGSSLRAVHPVWTPLSAAASLYLLAPLPLWNVSKEPVRSQLFCEGPGTLGSHKPGCESLLYSNRLCDVGISLELSEPHFFSPHLICPRRGACVREPSSGETAKDRIWMLTGARLGESLGCLWISPLAVMSWANTSTTLL